MNAAIAVISAVNLALNVGLNAWLSSFLGVAGIALSTSGVYACAFGLLFAATRRRLRSEIGASLSTLR
jgi:peptidoglycan biosynthesis protein MviN/MurJ (putative lipid II flippase)